MRRVASLLLAALTTVATVCAQPEKQRDCGGRTCYDVLGITSGSSDEEVKKAYRALAKQWHPDKNPDNVEEAQGHFTDIGNAYEILSTERHKYDQYLRYGGQQFDPYGRQRTHFHFRHAQNQYQQWQGGGGGQQGGGILSLIHALPFLMVGYIMLTWGTRQLNGGDKPAPNGHYKGGDKSSGDEDAGKEPPERCDRLPLTTRVIVHGVKAKPELNGKRGGVVSFDDTKGRYILQLEGNNMGDRTSLAPANVQPVVSRARVLEGDHIHATCRVVGSAPGDALHEDESWVHLVELQEQLETTAEGGALRLAPAALRLPEGARVTVVGLQSQVSQALPLPYPACGGLIAVLCCAVLYVPACTVQCLSALSISQCVC